MNDQIPDQILSILNEHSGGGFLLVRIDETGGFQAALKCDNLAYEEAVLSYAQKLCEAHFAVMKSELFESLADGIFAEFEFEDEEEEEDEGYHTGGAD